MGNVTQQASQQPYKRDLAIRLRVWLSFFARLRLYGTSVEGFVLDNTTYLYIRYMSGSILPFRLGTL